MRCLNSALILGGLLCILPALADKIASPTGDINSSTSTAFSLVDHYGNSVSDKDYRGKFMLIFFGYTYCPDVCPVDLKIITDALNTLGNQGQKIVPIFVTVDPMRDKRSVLADYVRFFHRRLVGLTGSRMQIDEVAKNYGVRYFKVFMPPVPGSDEDENTNYLVNHSAATYLVGPGGQMLTTFPHNTTTAEMATTIQTFFSNSN